MSSRRNCLLVASLILLIVVTGCGGGSSGFNATNVNVSIAPLAPTVAEGGQVTLQATVTGACSGCSPALTWSIAELRTNGASGAQCNWQGPTPPAGPCPDGTIEGAGTPPFDTVTFHAPSNPGTFHVIAEWSLLDPPTIKDGTATITVP